MKNATKEEQEKVAKKLEKNSQRGTHKNNNFMSAFGIENLFVPP